MEGVERYHSQSLLVERVVGGGGGGLCPERSLDFERPHTACPSTGMGPYD